MVPVHSDIVVKTKVHKSRQQKNDRRGNQPRSTNHKRRWFRLCHGSFYIAESESGKSYRYYRLMPVIYLRPDFAFLPQIPQIIPPRSSSTIYRFFIHNDSETMHSAYSRETKDAMALDREEKFLETQDDHSDIVGVTANEKAMTRRILLNLDFR